MINKDFSKYYKKWLINNYNKFKEKSYAYNWNEAIKYAKLLNIDLSGVDINNHTKLGKIVKKLQKETQ